MMSTTSAWIVLIVSSRVLMAPPALTKSAEAAVFEARKWRLLAEQQGEPFNEIKWGHWRASSRDLLLVPIDVSVWILSAPWIGVEWGADLEGRQCLVDMFPDQSAVVEWASRERDDWAPDVRVRDELWIGADADGPFKGRIQAFRASVLSRSVDQLA
jgi:hypothetical protein